ncbi:uncharacterized protein LOC117573397 isoform X3 [Drosophila albomicans]|uniref:Uncharacterized protein LOC117573397 isoform X1 n=1 Tax=Drosophila albomicans TaxID=7291 RepID=A0A6P8X8J4_DROAB|nr:uncharacterized protein LOC117573397 isoform X1 [Drosophila albomicans]XP_034112491.1 uncharacterized protein LOC117573397 isoform X2 [Drosophila albomicans]XP_051863025.1 uncharacterized protein LOC117573397 isoform X3 [Drosophila albomicans]
MAPKKKLKELQKLYAERWNYPPAQKPTKIKYIACGENPIYDKKSVYTACWKSPGMTANVQFGPCWDYPPERYKRYPLPPPCRGATLPKNSLLPKFEQCETLYTRYDYRLEECVHQQILLIEGKLRSLETRLTQCKEQQIKLAKQMRYQAIRRRLLFGSACGYKIYPEYLSQLAEERALCEFQKAYNEINASNSQLADEVLGIREDMAELRVRLDKLDRTLESPFLMGLETVLQTIQDLYDYFLEVVRKFKTWAQLIDAGQEHSIDDYLALLRNNLDFESFKSAGVEHCSCKRCRNKNPLDPYLPCWCQGCDRRDKNIQLVWDNQVEPNRTTIPQRTSDSDYVPKLSDTSPPQASVDKSSDDGNKFK